MKSFKEEYPIVYNLLSDKADELIEWLNEGDIIDNEHAFKELNEISRLLGEKDYKRSEFCCLIQKE